MPKPRGRRRVAAAIPMGELSMEDIVEFWYHSPILRRELYSAFRVYISNLAAGTIGDDDVWKSFRDDEWVTLAELPDDTLVAYIFVVFSSFNFDPKISRSVELELPPTGTGKYIVNLRGDARDYAARVDAVIKEIEKKEATEKEMKERKEAEDEDENEVQVIATVVPSEIEELKNENRALRETIETLQKTMESRFEMIMDMLKEARPQSRDREVVALRTELDETREELIDEQKEHVEEVQTLREEIVEVKEDQAEIEEQLETAVAELDVVQEDMQEKKRDEEGEEVYDGVIMPSGGDGTDIESPTMETLQFLDGVDGSPPDGYVTDEEIAAVENIEMPEDGGKADETPGILTEEEVEYARKVLDDGTITTDQLDLADDSIVSLEDQEAFSPPGEDFPTEEHVEAIEDAADADNDGEVDEFEMNRLQTDEDPRVDFQELQEGEEDLREDRILAATEEENNNEIIMRPLRVRVRGGKTVVIRVPMRKSRALPVKKVTIPKISAAKKKAIKVNKKKAKAFVACLRCGKRAEVQCSRCNGEFYCGQKCQQADWTRHSAFCMVMTRKLAMAKARLGTR